MARAPTSLSDAVDVHLHAAELGPDVKVGRLFYRSVRGRSAISFEYDAAWLGSRRAFILDPRLDLYAGEQFAAEGSSSFGIFLDSAPDRWGRVLLDRRAALAARDAERPMRALSDWDYLLGVQDECRMGALRFRRDDASQFLDDRQPPAPPVTSLRELEAMSLALEARDAAELPAYRQWLAALIAPGTSLGGSRPKANFREPDGSLWIAKFPSREDRRDIGAWEKVAYDLARDCDIEVSPARVKVFNSPHHTFCVRRFDRSGTERRFFVSAMTLLDRRDGAAASYPEIAEFIQDHGAHGQVGADLEQLFRRVLFNVLIGNTDDHLRNHGFIRHPSGWRLAPAYDLNPNPARRTHALKLDGDGDIPSIETVIATAGLYRLKTARAGRVLAEMRKVTSAWRARARAMRLPAHEIALVEPAFELSTLTRR